MDEKGEIPLGQKNINSSEFSTKTGEKPDVVLCAYDHEWHVHKSVLRKLPYFEALFSGCWSEVALDRVPLNMQDENITHEALNTVLTYLYHDVTITDPDTVINVLAASNLFILDDLIQQCADLMTEHIDMNSVCDFYTAGKMYEVKNIAEECVVYLKQHLMLKLSVPLLKDISLDLMTELIQEHDLFVLQVEMDLYVLLRRWLYIKLNPDFSGDFKELLHNTCLFINAEATRWQPSFLETELGKPYAAVFKNLRIQHMVNDFCSTEFIKRDKILPYDWVMRSCTSQWIHLLRVDSGDDIGPKYCDDATFKKNSVRWGIRLDGDDKSSWLFTGFQFGLSLSISCSERQVWLSRKTSSNQRMLTPLKDKHFMFEITVTTATSKNTTGIQHKTIQANESACLLRIDQKCTYPMYVQCNYLLYSPNIGIAEGVN